MSHDVVALLLRFLAALVWTALLVIRLRTHGPIALRLRVVDAAMAAVMWAFVYGGLVNVGVVPGEAAKVVYTAVATLAFILGLVLVTMRSEL